MRRPLCADAKAKAAAEDNTTKVWIATEALEAVRIRAAAKIRAATEVLRAVEIKARDDIQAATEVLEAVDTRSDIDIAESHRISSGCLDDGHWDRRAAKRMSRRKTAETHACERKQEGGREGQKKRTNGSRETGTAWSNSS